MTKKLNNRYSHFKVVPSGEREFNSKKLEKIHSKINQTNYFKVIPFSDKANFPIDHTNNPLIEVTEWKVIIKLSSLFILQKDQITKNTSWVVTKILSIDTLPEEEREKYKENYQNIQELYHLKNSSHKTDWNNKEDWSDWMGIYTEWELNTVWEYFHNLLAIFSEIDLNEE